jgi:hypothetical protein
MPCCKRVCGHVGTFAGARGTTDPSPMENLVPFAQDVPSVPSPPTGEHPLVHDQQMVTPEKRSCSEDDSQDVAVLERLARGSLQAQVLK